MALWLSFSLQKLPFRNQKVHDDLFEHITESIVEEEDVTAVDFDNEKEIDIVRDNQTLTALALIYQSDFVLF